MVFSYAKRPKLALLFTLLCSLLCINLQASAETRPQGYDLGLFGGYWEGSRNVESGSYLGISGAYHISRVFSLELNHGFIPTEAIKAEQLNLSQPESEPLTIQQGALNFVINLSPFNFVPYFNFGGGWLLADQETTWSVDVGFGAKYYLNDNFALKAALNIWMGGMDLRAEPYDHFTLTTGIVYSLGGKRDIDGDGVKNTLDQCPTTPEDKDGFEDQDGCPDEDNDGDGIKDSKDQCPNKAEDMDGDRDTDGCPDHDDDNDGISNEEDKCPNQAEDKDGFEDEDGCLDEDNDQDKIPDTKDRCPDEPESVNGFQDQDGCPEVDKDADGVFDSVDRCKAKKENRNGLKDHDGCPDEISAALLAKLGLQPYLTFPKGKDKPNLRRNAEAQFTELAELLKAEPLFVTITATAHKSDRADELSTERAQMVMSLLRERGVPAKRMRAVGAGSAELPSELQDTKKKKPILDWVTISPWPQEPKYQLPETSEKSAKKTATKELTPEKSGKSTTTK